MQKSAPLPFSNFRYLHWKWQVPVLHPTEMPNKDQFRVHSLFIHWEHVTENNKLNTHSLNSSCFRPVSVLQSSLQGDSSPATASYHQQAVPHTAIGMGKASTNADKFVYKFRQNPEKSRKIQKKSRKIQKNPEKSRSSKQRLLILRQSEYLQLWRGFFSSILTHQGDIREVHLIHNFTIFTVHGCFCQ